MTIAEQHVTLRFGLPQIGPARFTVVSVVRSHRGRNTVVERFMRRTLPPVAAAIGVCYFRSGPAAVPRRPSRRTRAPRRRADDRPATRAAVGPRPDRRTDRRIPAAFRGRRAGVRSRAPGTGKGVVRPGNRRAAPVAIWRTLRRAESAVISITSSSASARTKLPPWRRATGLPKRKPSPHRIDELLANVDDLRSTRSDDGDAQRR